MHTRRGFTLIELLAVMAILAILGTVGIVSYRKFQVRGQEMQTNAILTDLSTRCSQYETQMGDYPPDNFTGFGATPGNDLNTGIEALVASLARKDSKFQDSPISENELANTDDDTFNKDITKYNTRAAFEVLDAWKNPIVYFHRKSYGKKQQVLVMKQGTREYEEATVEAAFAPSTKNYRGANSFQLISAGYDGQFGTDDDIVVSP
jgi:prepilin-type N-terminal cleavage/methylation domain-containing protein